MKVRRLEREQLIRRERSDVFDFFARAENLERITPSWLRFRLLSDEPIEMGVGTLIDYRLRLHGLPLRWTSRIEDWEEDSRFVDRQVRGPYRLWRHTHEFRQAGGGTLILDRVEYALPLGAVGDVLGMPLVGRDLERIFDHRQAEVARLLG